MSQLGAPPVPAQPPAVAAASKDVPVTAVVALGPAAVERSAPVQQAGQDGEVLGAGGNIAQHVARSDVHGDSHMLGPGEDAPAGLVVVDCVALSGH
jgi:hypothetical protein